MQSPDSIYMLILGQIMERHLSSLLRSLIRLHMKQWGLLNSQMNALSAILSKLHTF